MNSEDLTILAVSTNHDSGETVHKVTGGFYHGSYKHDNIDYDVAVLRGYADLDIRTDI